MKKCLYCGNPVKNKYCSTSCQNKHQGSLRANNRYGEYKVFNVKCASCEKEFPVTERESFFPEKEKYFCSRSCSNKRKRSLETIEKIRKSLTKNTTYIIKKCENCGEDFKALKRKRKRRFCSRTCQTTYFNKTTDRCKKGGLKSSNVQKEKRRSKNEIYFSDLCKNKFQNVLFNEPIFNGWDADVIILDLKIAILWNGKWHYEKITRKHSVKQVQNRDMIKINEILNEGYIPYIIKDMGKYNPNFVENEFEKLKQYCGIE